ncbi:MAG: NADH-quinone oxidoreductase subunit C [Chloroflexota bacterium]
MPESDLVVQKLRSRFPDSLREIRYFRGETTVVLRREDILDVCRFLRDDPELQFDYLSDLCGVDYLGRGPRFEVVYNLYSLAFNRRLRLKVGVPSDEPSLPSVVGVWPTANWHEREVYDMFGLSFQGHPDLRRILMPDDWHGHPLRKDYPLTAEPSAFTHNARAIAAGKPLAKE